MENRQSGFFSNFLEYNGTFYGAIEKFFDMIAVSIYFVIGSLPVITIGASFSALYYAVQNSVRHDRNTITKAFWNAYRINLKQSVKIWLVVLGSMFILLLNIGILDAKMFNDIGIGFMVFYTISFVGMIGLASYAFPALSRFDEPAGWIIKLSLYLIVRHIPTTFILLILFGLCYLGVFFVPLLILVLPGVVTLLSTFLVEPILQKHTPETTSEL